MFKNQVISYNKEFIIMDLLFYLNNCSMNEQQVAQAINDLIRSVGVETLESWVFEVRDDYPKVEHSYVRKIDKDDLNVAYIEFDLTKDHFQKPILFDRKGERYLVAYLPVPVYAYA